MSILTVLEAVPSRFIAAYRFMLHYPEKQMHEQDLLQTLMPDATVGEKRGVLEATLREGVAMRLFEKWGEHIGLHSDLPASARDREHGEQLLPHIIADLIFAEENAHNKDFAHMVAWYLSQDPLALQGESKEVIAKLDQDDPEERTGLRDQISMSTTARFDNFGYWSTYLGFTWKSAYNKSVRLQSDPTQHLMWCIPRCFDVAGETVRLSAFLNRLATVSPVFEGGRFRTAVEGMLERRTDKGARQGSVRQERELSKSTMLALQRLQEAGVIELISEADASDLYTYRSGEHLERYTHIRRLV